MDRVQCVCAFILLALYNVVDVIFQLFRYILYIKDSISKGMQNGSNTPRVRRNKGKKAVFMKLFFFFSWQAGKPIRIGYFHTI